MRGAKKVLIVDDCVVMRSMIRDILSKNGFKVVGQAKNGAEAIDLYRRLRPDLVTMDIVMPGEMGIDVVKKIITVDPDAKVLMVSGLNQRNLIVQAMENGAREFVIKPFDQKDLLEAAGKACA
jgi:two-component system chemotaxis response regulator CheY